MQYENFSRHLREKYSTRLHVADQLVDQMKFSNRLQKPSIANKNEFEPYLNECLLAADRIKNNRCNNRDRQICYENLILAQKLERIKNTRINYPCRLFKSEPNNENRKLTKSPENSYHSSSSSFSNESKTLISENEDDQATDADVDISMEYCDSIPCKQRNNQNFFEIENHHIYQHRNNIDMMMIRDSIPLPTSTSSKHFSICILPHFDSDMIKSNYSKTVSHDRQYAFKKEILYH